MAFQRDNILPLVGKRVTVEMFSPTRCLSIKGVLERRPLSWCEFQVGDEKTSIVVFQPVGIHALGELEGRPNITLKG